MRCPSCQIEIPDTYRFCGTCGAPLPSSSERPTVTAPPADVAPHFSPAAADALPAGFAPGTVVAGRYRIVALLGTGGMGEVYRADDLKLGTAVAIKFLPRNLAADPGRRERFLTEVRLARQVTHPNVCRVFDIGEAGQDGGLHFLTMEFVDGEDLASLLRRIGRLPPDKALDIAHQICAGLAAAHERGVLHRDLKPANVMLDGRGRVRLTDFGLAVAADATTSTTDLSGTPAYMAPEQLAGKGASVRSDIYALGLVLYELYTGRRPFTSASLLELRRRKERDDVPAPSALVKDMDPSVERVILDAIASDPAARPASVRRIAAALPGGGPLQAILQAGGTPSPEMVAASGPSRGLSLPTAWTLLVLATLAGLGAAALGSRALLWRRAMPDVAPDSLAETARQTLVSLGYTDRPLDRAFGLEVDLAQLRYAQARDPVRWRSIGHEPKYVRFWYRESPQPLEAWRFPYQYGNVSRITPTDPPLDTAGMALVRLDPAGHLTQLVVVPAATTNGANTSQPPDWPVVLRRAGFDPSAWKPTAPMRNPPVYADARAAWESTWPARPELPVRIEAAALGSRVVYFDVVYPWSPAPRTPPPLVTPAERAGIVAFFFLIAAIIGGTAGLALRNSRAGRGDRRGAFRVSAFVFLAMVISWFFGESHVATLWEVALIVMALSWALAAAGFCWLAYLAVEPFLRRRGPEILVSWTRLLSGEIRDPLVGRDLLVGCVAGSALACLANTGFLASEWFGWPSDMVFADAYGVVYRPQGVIPLLVWRAAQSVAAGLAGVFVLLLLRLLFRSQWLAVAAFVAGASLIGGAGSGGFWISVVSTAILAGAFALLIVRFGLLAAVTQFYVWGLFIFFPITGVLDAWYAGAGLTALFVFAALVVFGFLTAVGNSRGLTPPVSAP